MTAHEMEPWARNDTPMAAYSKHAHAKPGIDPQSMLGKSLTATAARPKLPHVDTQKQTVNGTGACFRYLESAVMNTAYERTWTNITSIPTDLDE